MSTLKVSTISPLGTDATKTITIGESGDTLTIPTGVSMSGAAANTPAFHAFKNSNSNLTDETASKISIDTEVFDSGGKYDAGNYRFTPAIAGKYFIYGQVNLSCNAGDQYEAAVMMIYKNGSELTRNVIDPSNSYKHNQVTLNIGMTIDFNTTDYVEIYAQPFVGAGTPNVTGDSSASPTFFGGYRIIGV